MSARNSFPCSIALLCLLTGCVTPAYNYLPERTEISEPPLDTVNTAQVGDSMLRQGAFTNHDALFVEQDVKFGMIGTYVVKRGYYLKEGENDKSEFYLPSRSDDGGEIVRGGLADPPKILEALKTENKLCVVTVFNAHTCNDKAQFRRTPKALASKDSFQQTLIYSGKVGNKINVGYREYSDDTARLAFNNDVEYDLTESNTIGYKGARLEVLDATNEYIQYRVLQNFNRAEF